MIYSVMRKTFKTQPELFVARAELDHPSLHGLDGAEAAQSGPGNRKRKSTAQGKSGKATKFLMLYGLPDPAPTG
ncbi:hypothetical protein MNBD_ALPHA03-229 [hydrothermal vent metagenome]|uniref:Uncharacterized protein n=1 Tax=hydrothermal vent metagenome TaxID=652676 RepID=A0A3B1BSF3_9ZZZZ